MKALRAMALGLGLLTLAGCGQWVDIEGGCNQTEVDNANKDLTIIGQVGVATCAAHDAGKFESKFRCNGDTLQAKCSG